MFVGGWAAWCIRGLRADWRMWADRTLWETRPGCLLGVRGVAGRGVGVDVAGRWFHPVPETPDPGMVSHKCRM